MRDLTFTVYPEAPALGRRPFATAFMREAPPTALRRWRIVDAVDQTFGHARTRAGARAGARSLNAAANG